MVQRLRIAVADDDQEMRDYLEHVLTECGHQVVSVSENGVELLGCCRALHPDLVVTDIRMPKLDGIDASQAIWQERPVPVILVSGYHDPELIERAQADHVMGYLIKPIRKAQLEPAIALAIRRFREYETLSDEAANLRQSLAERKVIERAKGILMKITGADEEESFHRLRELASQRNQKLVDVASLVMSLENALQPVGVIRKQKLFLGGEQCYDLLPVRG